MVSSAAEIVFPAGALSTAMPFSVAASTSIVSTPTPARPMTLRRVVADIASRGTLAALRTMTASTSVSAWVRSARLRPGFVISSKRGSSRSGASPSAAILSAISTR